MPLLAALASAVVLWAGPGVIAAGAAITVVPAVTTSLTPSPPNTVPANCAQILSSAQTTGTIKAFSSAVNNGTTTTYFFQITSPQADGSQTGLEDCAYANGDPAQIKYEASANSPPFSSNTVYTSLTVTSTDSICDRVAITNGDGSTDYTNLVGAGPVGAGGAGAVDPDACAQGGIVPEAPAAGLIVLAGMGVAGAAWYVRRRRDAGPGT